MKSYKIGAVLYALWGVVHVIGGMSILAAWMERGAAGVIDVMGGPSGAVMDGSALLSGVAGYHFFNIGWIGAVVTVIAVTLNWSNSKAGCWFNLALVGLLDAGLIIFMLIPGHISWGEGMIGLGLFVPAAIFTITGQLQTSTGDVAVESPAIA